MIIKINGQEVNVEEGLTISRLVAQKKLCRDHVVVEYNGRILQLADWENIFLKEADIVEIVSFVGGG